MWRNKLWIFLARRVKNWILKGKSHVSVAKFSNFENKISQVNRETFDTISRVSNVQTEIPSNLVARQLSLISIVSSTFSGTGRETFAKISPSIQRVKSSVDLFICSTHYGLTGTLLRFLKGSLRRRWFLFLVSILYRNGRTG